MSAVAEGPRFPLTAGQRGVWFDQMLHPEAALYNMGGCLRIDGPVDPARFRAALQTLADRNDALRIVLRDSGEVPEQEILPRIDVAMELLDFGGDDDAAWAWMRAQIDVVFELFDGPLVQFALLRVADDRWYWFHKYHHIFMDAWSHSLLVQRLAAGDPDEPAYSFADAIRDDAAYAASSKYADALQYWQEKFRELPEPVVERKTFGADIRHRRSVLTLERAFYDRMIAAASAHQASTFHLILAALYVYFTRAGRRGDMVFGLPTLNRGTAAFKRTVGLFTGLTPFWLRLGRDLTTAELLAAIARELRKDYRHLRVPLSEINRVAGLHKTGRVQLFDVVVTYQKQSYDVRYEGSAVEQFSLRHGAEQTPLALEVSEYNDQLDVRVNIDSSVNAFTAEEIALFQRRLRHLLEQMIERPGAPVASLDLAAPDEETFELRPRITTYEPGPTLSILFDEQVRRAPHAAALWHDGKTLTYGELRQRVDDVANALRAHGVGPGSFVAIRLERGFDLIAAILGTLASGAAYVPLDPMNPEERNRFAIEDAGCEAVIEGGGPSPRVRGEGARRADEGSRRPPAYVIYTSGSTGKPKGTLVTHHNVVRLFRAAQPLYGFNEGDVWTLFHSPAFDFSVWEIFGALLHGGTLVIVPYWLSRSPDEVLRLISERKVTVLNQTPSAFAQLARAEESFRPPLPLALRWVIFGGEALHPAMLEPWFARHGDVSPRLVNMYGITETTVHVTQRPLSRDDVQRGRSVIGRPLDDLTLDILDEQLRPVPVGVPGEIYVGGGGVASGYVHRPELTAERFLDDPHRKGCRLYRSGDLARRLPDGDVEYLGRADDQVKIRGYRVELGEVRACLDAHPAVRESLVVADGERLVAYVIPGDGAEIVVDEVRAFLRKSLPEHMLPSAVMSLPAFPLTVNGKIDRASLPQPDAARPAVSQSYLEPRRDAERRIAAIWQDVLGIDRAGLRDNFFDLGGHSLLMARVRTRLRETFGADVPMAEMFSHPTIEALAALVSACEGNAEADAEALTQRPSRRFGDRQRELRTRGRLTLQERDRA